MRWPSTIILLLLPPIQLDPSMSVTWCPAFATSEAVARPEMPAPKTITDFGFTIKELEPSRMPTEYQQLPQQSMEKI